MNLKMLPFMKRRLEYQKNNNNNFKKFSNDHGRCRKRCYYHSI